MADGQVPHPSVPQARAVAKKQTRFSFVWIIPIVAALAGAWVAVTRILSEGPKITLVFQSADGLEAGKTFYDSLKLITRLVNIGDAKSLACHPASTTHRQMSPEQQRKAGVLPETIRLSIGIEHSSDIIEDIDQALAQACSRHQRLEAAE